jgi:outer membrane protein assembly factor BamB
LELQQDIYASLITCYGYIIVCTRQGNIYLLEEDSGEKTVEFGLPDKKPLTFTPAISDKELYAASTGSIAAFSLFSLANSEINPDDFLSPRWAFQLENDDEVFSTHLVAANSKVLAGARSKKDGSSSLYIFDAKNGEAKSLKLQGEISTPVFDEQGAMAIVATGQGEVFAIDVGTAEILFSNQADKIAGGVKTEIPPAVFDHKVWLFDRGGKLFYSGYGKGGFNFLRAGAITNNLVNAFSLSPAGVTIADGLGIESYSLYGTRNFANRDPGAIMAAPANTGHLVLAATHDGSLYIFSSENPSLARKTVVAFRQEMNTAPAASDDSVCVATAHGKVACYSFE